MTTVIVFEEQKIDYSIIKKEEEGINQCPIYLNKNVNLSSHS
jgi:hypothetical protein